MRITISLAWLFLALFFTAGCGPYITVNGETYRALDEKEELMLEEYARQAILNSRDKLMPGDAEFVKNNPPEMDISYHGNRSGTAKISWVTPKNIITLVVVDRFLTEHAYYWMTVEERQPELLRFGEAVSAKGNAR